MNEIQCPVCHEWVERLVTLHEGNHIITLVKSRMCKSCALEATKGNGVHKKGAERQETKPMKL